MRGKFNFAEGNRENPAGATRGGSEEAGSSEAGSEGFQAKLTLPLMALGYNARKRRKNGERGGRARRKKHTGSGGAALRSELCTDNASADEALSESANPHEPEGKGVG